MCGITYQTRRAFVSRVAACGACAVGALVGACAPVRLPWAAPARSPRVGILLTSGPPWPAWHGAFLNGMRAHGWTEGNNVVIERRMTDGRDEQLAEIMFDFVRLPVDVIVTGSAQPTLAAKQAT